MYENETKREKTIGCIVGVPTSLVRIFTSRIPQELITVSESGKKRIHNGDKKIIPVLDRLYDLKGCFNQDSLEAQNIKCLYSLQTHKKAISYERFVLLEYLLFIFPREKTSVSEVKVKFPDEVPIVQLSKEEVMVLYNWITSDETT